MEWKSDLETRLKWDWQDRREKSKQAPKKRNAQEGLGMQASMAEEARE